MTVSLSTAGVAENSAATGVAVTLPTVTATQVAVVTVAATSAVVTPPSGWTQVALQTGAPAAVQLTGVWYQVGAGASGSQTWSGMTSGRVTVCWQVFDGVDTTTPLDVAAATAVTPTAATQITVPSLTTVTNNAVLCNAVTVDSGPGVDLTTPAGMTMINGSTGTGRRHQVATELRATAGATGTRVWVETPTTTALGFTAVAFALRPAAVGAGSVTGVVATGTGAATAPAVSDGNRVLNLFDLPSVADAYSDTYSDSYSSVADTVLDAGNVTNFNVVAGTAPVASTDHPALGVSGAKFPAAASSNSVLRINLNVATSLSATLETAVFLSATPASDEIIATFRYASGVAARIVHKAVTGRLEAQDSAGTALFTTTASYSLTMVRVLEWITVATATTGSGFFAVYLGDSTTVAESGSWTTANHGTANLAAMDFGRINTWAYAYTAYFDSIQMQAARTAAFGPYLTVGSSTAVVATGTGAARPPVVGAAAAGTVIAVRATGSGAATPPGVTSGVDLYVDTYTDTYGASDPVLAVRATGMGAAPAPVLVVVASGQGAAVKATGTGLAPAPVVTGALSGPVTAVRASGTGAATPPTVSSGSALTFTDTFNRADVAGGAPGSTALGNGWTVVTGSGWCAIAGNQLSITTTTATGVIQNSQAGSSNDMAAQITYKGGAATSGTISLCVRCDAGNTNWLSVRFMPAPPTGNSQVGLQKCVAGSITNVAVLSAMANDLVPGDVLRVEVSGSTLTGFVNGVQVVQGTTASVPTGVFHAIRVGAALGTQLDNSSWGDLATATAPGSVIAVAATGTGAAQAPGVSNGTGPAAPTGVAVVPGDGQLRVTWTPPADPTVVGWNIYIGGVLVGSEKVPSTMVFDLTNGVACSVTVKSFNTVGTLSAATTAVVDTPAHPSAYGARAEVSSFGPNGTHWLDRTPWIYDTPPNVVSCACTWSAIAAAVNGFTAAQVNAGARVNVAAGTLPGSGGGSSSPAMMTGVGDLTWRRRVLVTPAGGMGSITFADDIRLQNVYNVAWAGFDHGGLGITWTGCSYSGMAWGKSKSWRILGLGGTNPSTGLSSGMVTEGFDMVEWVVPDVQVGSSDPGGFGSGFPGPAGSPGGNGWIRFCRMTASYNAPQYVETGGSGHNDAVQLYGSGVYYGFVFKDNALWGSNNSALQLGGWPGSADTYVGPIVFFHKLRHNLLINAGVGSATRYPLPGGTDPLTVPNCINGIGRDGQHYSYDTVTTGSLYTTNWQDVQNSRCTVTPRPSTLGAWTQDNAVASWPNATWDAVNPIPTPTYLASIWSASAPAQTPPVIPDIGQTSVLTGATAVRATGTGAARPPAVAGTRRVGVTGRNITLDGTAWVPNGATTNGSPADWQRALNVNLAVHLGLDMLRLTDFIDKNGVLGTAEYDATVWASVDTMISLAAQAGLVVELDLACYRNLLQQQSTSFNPYTYDWTTFLTWVANRVNTVTGLTYRNDPTIGFISFAGETGAPDQGGSIARGITKQQLIDFYDNVMTLWGTLAPGMVRIPGGLFFLTDSTMPWREIFSLASCDLPAIHSYSSDDENSQPVVETYVAGLTKPWIVEEYGFGANNYATDALRAADFTRQHDLAATNGAAGVIWWNCDIGSIDPVAYPLTMAAIKAYTHLTHSGTYRYYRFEPIALRTPGGSIQLDEWALLRNGTPVFGITVTAVNQGAGASYEVPNRLADRLLNSKWLSSNGITTTVTYDMGFPVFVNGYRFATGNDSTGRDPVQWRISGSPDGSTWTVLDTQLSPTVPIARDTYTGDFPLTIATNPAAVVAAGVATARPPTVIGLTPGAVVALRATGTGSAPPPPLVRGIQNVTATAVRATGTAAAVPPALTGAPVVVGIVGTATGAAPAPVVTATQTTVVGAVRAAGTSAAGIPTVTGAAPGQVNALPSTGNGAAPAPVVTGIQNVTTTGVKATGTGAVPAPTVTVIATVVGVVGAGTGTARPPVLTGVQNPTTTAVVATGTGTARPPVVTGAAVGQINAIRATGAGASPAPNVVAVIVSGLPTNVGLGRVTGRFAVADIQAGDIDGIVNLYPDTTDTITFTSTSALLLDSTASPDPVVIIPDPIVCTLDANGYLVDTAGNRWVYLIATDDPDIAPATRRWRVTFSAGLGIPSFLMNVGTGSTIDLSTVIPTA